MKHHKTLTDKQRRYLGLVRKMLANDLTEEQFNMNCYKGTVHDGISEWEIHVFNQIDYLGK